MCKPCPACTINCVRGTQWLGNIWAGRTMNSKAGFCPLSPGGRRLEGGTAANQPSLARHKGVAESRYRRVLFRQTLEMPLVHIFEPQDLPGFPAALGRGDRGRKTACPAKAPRGTGAFGKLGSRFNSQSMLSVCTASYLIFPCRKRAGARGKSPLLLAWPA